MSVLHNGAFMVFGLSIASIGLHAEPSLDDEVNSILRMGIKANDWNQKDASLQTGIAAKLRKIMTDDREVYRRENAHVQLLNVGDNPIKNETFRRYKKTYWERKRMAAVMGKTTQVLLIPVLAGDLASQEPLKYRRYGSEFLDYPISVESSDVIRRIIINAPSLDSDVKKWATGLSSQRPEELVEQMRKFWSQNSAAFVAKEYTKIAPPK